MLGPVSVQLHLPSRIVASPLVSLCSLGVSLPQVAVAPVYMALLLQEGVIIECRTEVPGHVLMKAMLAR